MLYASAHGCNVGIKLYPLLDLISTANFSSTTAMLKSFVRLFPSRTALDSRLQSTWFMQDTLQTILIPGTVLGASDSVVINSFNTASLLFRDRTDDGNAFLVFAAMAAIGTSLNRNSFLPSDDPAALAYTPDVPLPWITEALIEADTVHAGCSLASSFYNMFDAIRAVQNITTGAVSAAFGLILSAQVALDVAGQTQCGVDAAGDPFPAALCATVPARLRYRDACFESTGNAAKAVSSFAAGVIKGIKLGWL